MFKDLSDSTFFPRIPDYFQIQELKLSKELRSKIKEVLDKTGQYESNIESYSSIIKQSSGQYVYFPNQYYLIALKCKEYANCLLDYCNFLDEKKASQSFKDSLKGNDFKTEKGYKDAFSNEEEMNKFTFFLTGSALGKSAIDSNGIRQTKDIFGSRILAKLQLPNASSGFIGDLIYQLYKDGEIISELEKEILFQEKIVRISLGKETLNAAKKLVDILYKYDKLDRLLALFVCNDKYLKIRTSEYYPYDNLLRYVFCKINKNINPTREGNRVFVDKNYTIGDCSADYTYYLTTEWKDTEPFDSSGGNYLNVLSKIVNDKYSNIYKIVKEQGAWYLYMKENSLTNIILYGPPGTGKTYKMQHEYIDKFAKEDRFITTFHQSFSYEEFIEGLKPVLADKPDGSTSSDVKYEIRKGIFYLACERAAELAGYESKKDEAETPLQKCIADVDRSTKMQDAIANNKTVLLCIDEINRANVSAVFGDLISLIEPSKRIGAENEMVVQLPYSKEDFAVPANLMIVGTMNTADRSIQLLDSALRRRFRFEELLPDYEEIKNSERAKVILKAINARIRCLLDKDHQIGHSYFIEAKNDLDIFNALKDSVIPLLEEYFYNDAQKIRQILNENDNTENAFYIKDEEAKKASESISLDYDDEKAYYQLNPELSKVKDEAKATSFIAHITPKAE